MNSLPKSIWIAGCGYVGRLLAESLCREGVEVLGLTRTETSAQALREQVPFPVRGCDLSSILAVYELADSTEIPEAIVHCASSGHGGIDRYRTVYLEGCINLLSACPESRLLFTSSTSVYAQTGGETVTEDSPAQPLQETGKILRDTEEFVLRKRGIVARLSGIYGPGRCVHLQRFLDGTAVIESGTSRFLNQIHRDDIVAALMLLLRLRETTASQIYNVSDGDHLTQRSCYEALAEFFRRPLPPEGPADSDKKRGWTHKRVDSFKLRALGWKPRYPSLLDALRLDPELGARPQGREARV